MFLIPKKGRNNMLYPLVAGLLSDKKEEKKGEKKEEKKESTYTYSRKECHTGTVPVFKDPETGVEICGGGRWRDVVLKQSDLLIDIGIKLDNLIQISGLKKPWRLLKFNRVPAIIKIDWSDRGVPDLGREFWDELIQVIRTEKKRVVISCVGGHGRTGTALSILAALMGIVKTDPVKFVRDNYCDEAVETIKQILYVEEMTGIKVEEKSSKSYTTVYNNSYSNSDWYNNCWKKEKEGELT